LFQNNKKMLIQVSMSLRSVGKILKKQTVLSSKKRLNLDCWIAGL